MDNRLIEDRFGTIMIGAVFDNFTIISKKGDCNGNKRDSTF